MDSRITIKESPECSPCVYLFYGSWSVFCTCCTWPLEELHQTLWSAKEEAIRAAEGHLKRMDQLRTKEAA